MSSSSSLSCQDALNFYEDSYKTLGFNAQRKYPNEELCRFMGRNFFHFPTTDRKNIKILETGCGSGANIWMIAKEGFDTYGIDLSPECLPLAKKMLDNYNTQAKLSVQNMCMLDFPENFFDAVIDIFSSYCLNKEQHFHYLKEVKRVLKSGGLFFSYFPSKKSDAYQIPEGSIFIDSDTLSAITRLDSPFYGQNYPFRFTHPCEYENTLKDLAFKIQYSETVDKTYRNQRELFGFVSIEARKI